MSSMSYCRFQNTDNYLTDCKHALEALYNDPNESLSEDEKEAAVSLIARCADIIIAFCENANVKPQLFIQRPAVRRFAVINKRLDAINAHNSEAA